MVSYLERVSASIHHSVINSFSLARYLQSLGRDGTSYVLINWLIAWLDYSLSPEKKTCEKIAGGGSSGRVAGGFAQPAHCIGAQFINKRTNAEPIRVSGVRYSGLVEISATCVRRKPFTATRKFNKIGRSIQEVRFRHVTGR